MYDEKIVDQLSDLVSSFICYAGSHLPDDVDAKLKEMAKVETEGFAPTIYKAMADNMELANELKRPSCQDTGIIQFFAKVGTNYPYQNELPEALKQAVLKATERAPLRHNAVQVFDEINTGNNVGVRVPWIDWELVPDRDDIELYVYMAGGGCSLPGMAKVLMPLEGYEGIVRIIFDQMTSYGVNACPPVLLGVGIAGSAEVAAKLSKKALLRPVGSHNENPKAAMMEEELEKGLNELGLGPGGLSGKLSVMGVNIEQAARHPATLAVGISTACWAHRRGCIKINPDLTYDFVTSKGVTL
ncbi:MAG: L(+)-tartrate dehydratase subunit alpha [Clostridiales bacterium]|jgi:L(+)-tartrate dehydratase alpha subunit|nr:L(+)-tartrate dehydratase subunit alpha [Clostridiales bacterium]